MGTNYYYQYHTETGRAKDLHIGKYSMGWEFSFRGYRDGWSSDQIIKSFEDWKSFFQRVDGEIFDEYDKPIKLDEFIKLVEGSRKKPEIDQYTPQNHTIYCREKHPEHAERDCWLDDDGWSFSDCEFS